LNSYAKDHPLYKAIKKFERIIKTNFILTYIDELNFGQRMEQQLNCIELSNKFSKAVFFANNREFKYGTKEEQEIAISCKVLIQNAIVLWNYLYIFQSLLNSTDQQRNQLLLDLIKNSSMIAWTHINMNGEYDFNNSKRLKSSFNIKKILNLKLAI